jgi:hypothetical protein
MWRTDEAGSRGNMWVQQASAAAAIVAVAVVGTGAVALILRALGVLPWPSRKSMSCPNCGGATRFHSPYLMCDDCKRCVGIRINGKAHVSR